MRTKASILKLWTVTFLLFTFSFTLTHAQEHTVDSLRNALKTEKDDTNKILTLSALSWDLTNMGGNHEADSLAHLALTLSEKFDYQKGIYKAYNSLGGVCWALADYPGAMAYFNKSLDAAKKLNSPLSVANCLSHIGSIFNLEGNLPEALKYDLQSLSIYEAENNDDGKSKMYNNIGNVYTDQANQAEAIRYYKMSREIALKRKDDYGIIGTCMNLGIGYYLQKKYDSALVMFDQCLPVAQKINDAYDIGEIYANLGIVYEETGNHTEAMNNMFKSLTANRVVGNKRGMCNAYSSIGELYRNAKNYVLAKSYYDSAMVVANMIDAKSQKENIYKNYAALDSTLGDFKSSLMHYKLEIAYHDSMKNEENTKKIVQEQMQYDFDKKETEQKAEQVKKDAITAADKKRQQVIIGSVTIVLLLVMLFAGLLFNRFRLIKKQKEIIEIKSKETEQQKKLIEEQKTIVDEKNKDITDSIHYASRIQRALLTTDAYIWGHVNECFMVFKPRDIVSGDFYWANEADTPAGKRFLICAGDCTGHGVPGAFMSLLNISLLNEANIERKINSPDKILNHIRDQIIKALNADGDEKGSKDGMDCVLCSFDFTEKKLEVACANNPLWIVPAGGTDVVEYKADKMPVGMQSEKPEPFSLQTIPFKKGDMIYMFTDGYADQFGGPKGKKFKYKQLQDLIVSISQKPMKEQKKILEQTIEQWKGGLEQIDDILIIGIRV